MRHISLGLALIFTAPLVALGEPHTLTALIQNLESSLPSATTVDARTMACQMAQPELGRPLLASYICQRFQALGAVAFRLEATTGSHNREIQRRLTASGMNLDQLIAGLGFFLFDQRRTVEQMTSITEPQWQLRPTQNPASACRYRVGPESPALQQIKFSNFTFLASSHLFNLPPSERASFRSDFMRRLNSANPDALLVEGMQIAQPSYCESVIEAALTPEAEITNERDLALRYAFIERKSIIPSDGQELTELMVSLFLSGDATMAKALATDFAFVDALQTYRFLLQQNFPNPLEEAVRRANEQNPRKDPPLTAAAFRERYQILNKQTLPTDQDTLHRDLTPSSFTSNPRGTNMLIDKQNEFRNRALLLAIQSSATIFLRPMAIYGSGHLADIGPTLEEKLGPANLRDFRGSCQN